MPETTDTLLCGDSLRRAFERLFIEGARSVPEGLSAPPSADTLPPTSAADLYGALSTLAPQTAAAGSGGAEGLLAPSVQLLMLLLGLFYVLLISSHPGMAWELATRTAAPHGRTADPAGGGSLPFLNRAGLLALLFGGLLALRLGTPHRFAAELPQPALALLAAACFALVLLLQCAMLRLAGALTLTRELTDAVIAAKRSALALYALLLPPVLLCYLPLPAGSGAGILGCIVVLSGIVLFLFLKSTLELFVAKKVSISHWILYLCTVELFPISLLWQLVARHG